VTPLLTLGPHSQGRNTWKLLEELAGTTGFEPEQGHSDGCGRVALKKRAKSLTLRHFQDSEQKAKGAASVPAAFILQGGRLAGREWFIGADPVRPPGKRLPPRVVVLQICALAVILEQTGPALIPDNRTWKPGSPAQVGRATSL